MSGVVPAFELLGLWDSPRLLLRLMLSVKSPWQALESGFTHRETGERVALAMGGAQPSLVEAFVKGVDPLLPTIDAALARELGDHRSIVVVTGEAGSEPVAAAVTALRGADAVVNGGALAVRCRTSGLAHGADGFQLLVAEVERARGDAEALARALVRVYVRLDLDRCETVGLHALGAADVKLAVIPSGPGAADRACALLEAAAVAAVGSGGLGDPDTRSLPRLQTNPFGVRVVASR